MLDNNITINMINGQNSNVLYRWWVSRRLVYWLLCSGRWLWLWGLWWLLLWLLLLRCCRSCWLSNWLVLQTGGAMMGGARVHHCGGTMWTTLVHPAKLSHSNIQFPKLMCRTVFLAVTTENPKKSVQLAANNWQCNITAHGI